MQCSGCKHDNPDGAKFCGECGARLAHICQACAHPNPVGQKFCGECGARLTAADAPAPAGASPAVALVSAEVQGEREG
jgi:hypothetical protein